MNWQLVSRLHDYFKETPAPMQLGKIGEEYGEAWEAYINLTGNNPRKDPADWDALDVCAELADVIISAAVALHHFTDDPEGTFRRLCGKYERRLAAAEEAPAERRGPLSL